MATLGDLLALVHDAAVRARPAQLTVAEWRHGPRSAEAWDAFMRARHGTTLVHASGQTPQAPIESRWSVRLSYDARDRFREESAGPQTGVRYLVRDGARWLSWDADWGLVTSDSEPDGGPPSSSFGFLLDSVELVAALRFDHPTEGTVAGRPTLATSGTPRWAEVGSAIFRVGPGADVIELAFDAETGALLRSEAHIGGEPFHRLEVAEISYTAAPPQTFAVEPPPDYEGAPGPWARPMALPLHELATTSPFTVLVPRRVPDGWRVGITQWLEGRDHPSVEATAFLDYASPEGAYSVSVRQRATDAADAPAAVVDNGPTVSPRYVVTIVQSGTWVELSGAERELLLDLSRELVPAPTEPPHL